jgi:hypothetical protein
LSGTADPEDQLQGILKPGERILWADRPHDFLRTFWSAFGPWQDPYRLVPLAVFTLGVLAYPVAFFAQAGFHGLFWRMDASFALVVGCGLAVPGVVFLTILRRFLEAIDVSYAVTDQGRAIVVSSGKPVVYDLPPPEAVELDAGSGSSHGNVALFGDQPGVFHGILAPAASFATIQTIARDRADARRRETPKVFEAEPGEPTPDAPPPRGPEDMRRAIDRWRARG